MEKKIKKEIIKSVANIKKKVKILKGIQQNSDAVLDMIFKPITAPLNQMKADKVSSDLNHNRLENNKNEKYSNSSNDEEVVSNDGYKDFAEKFANQTLKTAVVSSPANSDAGEEHEASDPFFASFHSASSPKKPSISWSLSSEVIRNVPFGLRWEGGKLMMGKMRVYDEENHINIGGKRYVKTQGLMQLLAENAPDLNIIEEEDKQNYKLILNETNAHRRDYDPQKPIKSNKGMKYNYIIKPLFKLVQNDIGSSTEGLVEGKGIDILKEVKKKTEYIYWDDPNELVERLKLLIASRDAGNTGLENEIISIIEELREANIISEI